MDAKTYCGFLRVVVGNDLKAFVAYHNRCVAVLGASSHGEVLRALALQLRDLLELACVRDYLEVVGALAQSFHNACSEGFGARAAHARVNELALGLARARGLAACDAITALHRCVELDAEVLRVFQEMRARERVRGDCA